MNKTDTIIPAQPGWYVLYWQVTGPGAIEITKDPIIAWHIEGRREKDGFHADTFPITAFGTSEDIIPVLGPTGRVTAFDTAWNSLEQFEESKLAEQQASDSKAARNLS